MKINLIAVIAVLVVGVILIGSVVSSDISDKNDYTSYLETARANAENDIPYIAVQNYKSAFEIDSTDESVFIEYLEQTKLLGEDFYSTALSEYISYFPDSANAYEVNCKFYYDDENFSKVITLASDSNLNNATNENLKNYYYECFYMYRYIKTGFDEASSFLGNSALVKVGGKYGYIGESGSYILAPVYDYADHFLGTATGVCLDDEWYMINSMGYKVAKPDGDVDSLGMLSGNKILVSKNGKFTYVSTSMKLPESFNYEYATNFKNGLAAVKQGGKWGLINSDGEMVVDYIYDDIIVDEFNTCINNGVIFAKTNGSYIMIDEEGDRIGSCEFSNAYPFVGSQPAAVCVDGKWGFVSKDGTMVIEPTYSNAKSFNCNIAPVMVDGKWGYIDSTGEMRIDAVFTDCKPFADCGIAAVCEEGCWSYIKLLGFYS